MDLRFLVLISLIPRCLSVIMNQANECAGLTSVYDSTILISDYKWTLILRIPMDPYERAFDIIRNNFAELRRWYNQKSIPGFIAYPALQYLDALWFRMLNIRSIYGKVKLIRRSELIKPRQKRYSGSNPSVTKAVVLRNKELNFTGARDNFEHHISKRTSILDCQNTHLNVKHLLAGSNNFSDRLKKSENMASNEKLSNTIEEKLIGISLLVDDFLRQIDLLEESINELRTSIQFVGSGHLSDYFLKGIDFLEVLTMLEKNLPQRFKMLYPVTKYNLYQYYDLVETQVGFVNGTLYIYIDIPLSIENGFFNLYRIISMPLNINDSKNETKIYTFKLPTEYLAVNSNESMYVSLSFNDISLCRKESITICPSTTPIRTFREKTCIHAIYNNLTLEVSQYCDRTIAPITFDYPQFQKLQSSNAWFFSVLNETNCTTDCWNSSASTQIITLKGCGVIYIPYECDVMGENFRLNFGESSNFETERKLLGDMRSEIQRIEINPAIQNLSKGENVNILQENEPFSHNESLKTLNELSKSLEILDKDFDTFVITFVTFFILVCAIFAIFIFYLCNYFCHILHFNIRNVCDFYLV